MDILIARENLADKPKKTTLKELKEKHGDLVDAIHYFDRENSHKNMISLADSFEKDGFTVYFREVKYGLTDEEYLYEVHIVKP